VRMLASTNWRYPRVATLVALLVVISACGTGAAQSGNTGPTITLRAGCTNPQGTLVCNAIDKFAALVSQKTNGRIKIVDLYAGLGIEAKLIQEVQDGTVDFGTITAGNSVSFSKALSAYSLPFLFDSYNASVKSLDSAVGKTLVKQYESDAHIKFIMGIGFGAGRDIETRNKPVRTPRDLRGLKIRSTASPVEVATYKAWGANPTSLDFSQLLTALQQGAVDGCDLDPPAVLSTKLYEGVRYEIELDYANDLETFVMNPAKFASLSKSDQQAITDAAKEASAYNLKEAADELGQDKQQLKANGVTIYTPTAAERAQWTAVREAVWQAAAGSVDLTVAQELHDSQST
jgi:TRAP-type C4-dicarboxylate transport system substrate-binding protein